MRLFAILLMLAGFALAFGYPLYQADFTGEEFHRSKIYDRAIHGSTTSWYPTTLELTEADNPIRIRLEGKRAAGDSYLGATLPVDIELKGPDGTVLAAQLDMTLSAGSGEGGASEQRLYVNAPDFDVFSGGSHTLTFQPKLDRDISVLVMEAVFLRNVERPDNEYLRPGLVIAGMGGMLYLLGSRRRKKRDKKRNVASNPKKPRWGRQ